MSTFEFWWNRNGSNSEFVRNAHSLGLENLAELGLPGLLLVAAVLIAALAALVRVRRRVSAGAATDALAAVCVYVMQANVDWLCQSTAVTMLALALVAPAAARRSGSGWPRAAPAGGGRRGRARRDCHRGARAPGRKRRCAQPDRRT